MAQSSATGVYMSCALGGTDEESGTGLLDVETKSESPRIRPCLSSQMGVHWYNTPDIKLASTCACILDYTSRSTHAEKVLKSSQIANVKKKSKQ